MSKKKHNGRGFILYPNYHFRDQDPEIGRLMSELKRKQVRDTDVKADSGVSHSTLRSMRMKKTRNAFHSTLVRIARTIDEDYKRVPWDGKNK